MDEQNNLPKKENKGFLFVNANKNKTTQPDSTGRIIIDGKEWRISSWNSLTHDGRPYQSLALTPYIPPDQNNQQNGNKSNNSNNSHSYGNNQKSLNNQNRQATPAAPLMDDFDIDDILNSTDD